MNCPKCKEKMEEQAIDKFVCRPCDIAVFLNWYRGSLGKAINDE